MNYPGLEHLRADVAALSNAMCDVRMLLNRLESQHRHDAATLTTKTTITITTESMTYDVSRPSSVSRRGCRLLQQFR